MRRVLTLLIVIAALFCGWWFAGAHLFRQGVENWFAAQQAAGRDAQVQGFDVGGFPTRFVARADAVAVSDLSGWGWQSPGAEVSMPSWWPFHVTARLPDRQVIDTPRGQVDLTGQGMEGRFTLSPSLAPVRLHAEAASLVAAAADGTLRADRITFDSDRTTGTMHHAVLAIDGLGVDAGPVALNGGTLRSEANVTLAERVDDLPDAVAVPVEAIALHRFDLRFDDVAVTATGDVVADGRGFAAGEVTVRLENWPAALDAAVSAGLIPEDRVAMLEGGFRMMAEDGVLELPLTLSSGQVRFGPLPVGPAPRLK